MLRRFALVGILVVLGSLVSTPARAQTAHEEATAKTAQVEHAVHGEADAHTEAAGEAHREHEVIEFDAATAVWVLIIFAVLLIVLYPTAWKNVLGGLKAREERIRKDIADAEAARVKAEHALTKYQAQLATAEQQVRDLIGKASADAERIAAGIRTHAQAESEDIKERAIKDVENARKAAIDDIHNYAADLATSIAEKILRRNLNANDQKDLVKQSLEQIQTIAK